MRINNTIIYIPILFIIITSCNYKNTEIKDINDINADVYARNCIANKRIRVALPYNSIDFYSDRGILKGMQYELLKLLAKDINVKIDFIKIENNFEEAVKLINTNKIDLYASMSIFADSNISGISHINPIGETDISIISNKRNEDKAYIDSLNKIRINISKEFMRYKINNSIKIKDIHNRTFEDIVIMINNDILEYTVGHKTKAMVLQKNLDKISIGEALKKDLKYGWIISSKDTTLRNYLNKWFIAAKTNGILTYTKKKYFSVSRPTHLYTFNANKKYQISAYDNIVKKEMGDFKWDWKMIIAMMHTESHFRPNVKSNFGAFGLMQITPTTAQLMRVKDYKTPEGNIKCAIRYIKYLDKIFAKTIHNKEDRVSFVMASYNAGAGHIMDAMRLAKKYNKNPHKWNNNVDYYLVNKSKSEFLNDSLVKFGYCNGIETYNFVNRVMKIYNIYKIIPTK